MEMTPEIEAILGDLAQLCMNAASGNEPTSSNRIDALVSSLARNGWERKRGDAEPLAVQLRQRIEDASSTRPTYHAEQLEGVIQQVQKAYDQAIRFRSSIPEEDKSPGDKNENQTAPPQTTLNANSRL